MQSYNSDFCKIPRNKTMKSLLRMIVTIENDYDEFESVKFILNGKKLKTRGTYSGENEDNTRSRDYQWVEEAIKEIVEELNCDFELEERYGKDYGIDE